MRNIVKSIIFLFVLLVLVEISIYILVPKGNSEKYNYLEKAEYEILQEKRGTIDVIFIGNELVSTSINPLMIWNDYGYTVFNISKKDYDMSEVYDSLEVATDYQKPKVIMIESNILLKSLKDNSLIEDVNKTISNLVPIIEYHNNWKNLFSKNQVIGNFYKGYEFTTEIDPSKNYDYLEMTKKNFKIEEENINILKRIINLCEKKNIKLLIVSTPSQTSIDFSKRSALIRLSRELEFSYIDLNIGNPLEIDWTMDTKDKGEHLNYLGAEKVTHYIGKYLDNIKLLDDHRNDQNYASWNNAYEKFKEEYEIILE